MSLSSFENPLLFHMILERLICLTHFCTREFSLVFFGAFFLSYPMEKHLTRQLVLSGVPLRLIIYSLARPLIKGATAKISGKKGFEGGNFRFLRQNDLRNRSLTSV